MNYCSWYLWLILIIAILFFLFLTIILIYEFSLTTQNKPLNELCTNDKECQGDLICNNGVCSTPFIPLVPPQPSGPQIGQTCIAQNCIPSTCNGSTQAYCNANHICSCGSIPKNGIKCSANSQCALGSYCSASGICTAGQAQPIGDECDQDDNCQIGAMCDYDRVCRHGNPELQCSFTDKQIVPVSKYDSHPVLNSEVNSGAMSLLNNKLSYNCFISSMSYQQDNNLLTVDQEDVYVQNDGTLGIHQTMNNILIARVSSDKQSFFFTDMRGNSLQLPDSKYLSSPCLDNNLFWFYDPDHYTNQNTFAAPYVKFKLIDN